MATPTRPKFPPECFTSPWTSVTGYDVGEQATTVTAMVGCPSPFRVYESPVNGEFKSEHVTDLPDLPECCGPFTKVPDSELDYLEATNVLCPENYGITKVDVKSEDKTNGQCIVTVDSLEAVETAGETPTITQIATFNLNWDQAVLSEKYGVTMVAPTGSSGSDAADGGANDDSDSGPNLPAIIAPSVIGGLIFIAILVFAAWCTQRRRSRRTKPAQYSPPQQQQPPEMQYPAPQPQQQVQYPAAGVPVYAAPGAAANPSPGYESAQQPQQQQQAQVQYAAAGAPVYSTPNAPVNPNPVYEPVPVPQAYGQAPAPIPSLPEVEGHGRQNMQ